MGKKDKKEGKASKEPKAKSVKEPKAAKGPKGAKRDSKSSKRISKKSLGEKEEKKKSGSSLKIRNSTKGNGIDPNGEIGPGGDTISDKDKYDAGESASVHNLRPDWNSEVVRETDLMTVENLLTVFNLMS